MNDVPAAPDFGLRPPKTAEELGISKSWASLLHTKALDRLRAALRRA